MKNKIELKKMLVLSIFMIIILSIIWEIIGFYQYKTYTKNFNQKMAEVITNVSKTYPDVDKNELIKILNSEENIDIDLFKSYGIELNKERINFKK